MITNFRACCSDMNYRPPSWLHKTWIQDLLKKAADQETEHTRGTDAILHLFRVVAQLRHAPSSYELDCLKAKVFHNFSRISSAKMEQLKLLSKTLNLDLGLCSDPSVPPATSVPLRLPPAMVTVERQEQGNGAGASCTLVNGQRFYNFDQLVQALGCGPDAREKSVSQEISDADGISIADTNHSRDKPVSSTVLQANSSLSTVAVDDEQSAGEMFGRRKQLLVLDVSRIAEIKMSLARGDSQHLVALSCPLLAHSCSWSICAQEGEAGTNISTQNDKGAGWAAEFDEQGEGPGDARTARTEQMGTDQWLKVDMVMPPSGSRGKWSSREKYVSLEKYSRAQGRGSDRRVQLTCSKWQKNSSPMPYGLLLTFKTSAAPAGTVLKALLKVEFDGHTVVVRPRMISINIEVLVNDYCEADLPPVSQDPSDKWSQPMNTHELMNPHVHLDSMVLYIFVSNFNVQLRLGRYYDTLQSLLRPH
jgi:hypothetical protein